MSRRKGLERVVGGPEAYPSISVIEARVLTPPELVRREAERRLQERIRREAGPVIESFDPSVFKWLRRRNPRPKPNTGPAVRITRSTILFWGVPELDEWEEVEIGVTSRAIAFRASSNGEGWKVARLEKATRNLTHRVQTPNDALEELEKNGWTLPVTLPLKWDRKNQILVAKRPPEQTAPQDGKGAEG